MFLNVFHRIRLDTAHNYVFPVHASVALHSTEYSVLTKATMLPTSDSVGYSLAACFVAKYLILTRPLDGGDIVNGY